MIVRCGLLKKNDKFTQESFSHHWLHIHGPIAAGMKNLRVYNQNLVIDNEHRHPITGGAIDIDGYSELHFDTYSEMLEGVQSLDAETGNALLDDAEILLQKRLCDILVFFPQRGARSSSVSAGKEPGSSRVVLESGGGGERGRIPSRVVLCSREAGGGCSRPCGLQSKPRDRPIRRRGERFQREAPCDGMAEFYFEDMDAFECFYDSKEFQRLTAHGSEFIGSVDTYLVETHPVVAGSAHGGYCRIGEFCETIDSPLPRRRAVGFEAKLGLVSPRSRFDRSLAPSCPRMASYDKVRFWRTWFLRVVEFVIWPYREVFSPAVGLEALQTASKIVTDPVLRPHAQRARRENDEDSAVGGGAFAGRGRAMKRAVTPYRPAPGRRCSP